MELKQGHTFSHYQLAEKLGEGGMGIVWKAKDLKLDRFVAVKFLPESIAKNPEKKALFEREAKAVAAISHPNIITIYSVEETDQLNFFTMELVKGHSLSELMIADGLPLDNFINIAVQLADAVSAAHEHGIIHRDLKPQNIMIDNNKSIKILDFGLARFLKSDTSNLPPEKAETATVEEGFYGTICYTSPEQLRNEILDHRADLFSLGIILFELATGRHPFEGKTNADVMASILKDKPLSAITVNPRIPQQLNGLLEHCLEKDRRNRITSALELKTEILNLQPRGIQEVGGALPSVAVLPFSDLSREQDQAYFCEGIAEEIINALNRIQGIRVVSRTASFQFSNKEMDPREIGRRLHVDTLLEGSVRKYGNRFRILAQLFDAKRGFHIWSESFDRELKDIFMIQEEIAKNIAGALRVTLSPQESGALHQTPTSFIQAYEYYLRGRSYYYKYRKQDIEFALQLFSRATELDRDYALAYAGLADCWSYIYLYSERKETIRTQALSAAQRALELAPDSAQAQASHALAMSISGRNEEADKGFRAAIRLDPTLFEAWYFYARHLFVNGFLEKAAQHFEGASRVRPDDYQSPLLVAQIYDNLNQSEKARSSRQCGVALVADRLELHPDDSRALYMGANGLVALGEREKGLEWAHRALKIDPEEPMLLYNLGCIYSLAGEIEEALDTLEKAVDLGLTQKGWYEHDSNLDPLREHSRFKALMDKLG